MMKKLPEINIHVLIEGLKNGSIWGTYPYYYSDPKKKLIDTIHEEKTKDEKPNR